MNNQPKIGQIIFQKLFVIIKGQAEIFVSIFLVWFSIATNSFIFHAVSALIVDITATYEIDKINHKKIKVKNKE